MSPFSRAGNPPRFCSRRYFRPNSICLSFKYSSLSIRVRSAQVIANAFEPVKGQLKSLRCERWIGLMGRSLLLGRIPMRR